MLKIIFDVNFSKMLKFRHFFSNLERFQRYLIQNGRLAIKMVEMLSKIPLYRYKSRFKVFLLLNHKK